MSKIDEMSRWRVNLLRISRQAWVRAALYCVGGVLVALFA